MQYTREMMTDHAEEVETFARHHTKTREPLEFNWKLYTDLDYKGAILFMTARDDDGKLVGFLDYIMRAHMHHRWVMAECDLFIVDPGHKREGIDTELLRQCQMHLKAQGVTHIVQGCRVEDIR